MLILFLVVLLFIRHCTFWHYIKICMVVSKRNRSLLARRNKRRKVCPFKDEVNERNGALGYLSVTEAPHNTDFHTWMGKKHFFFFQTAETGNRTPNSGVKGSGVNHYPRAPALKDEVTQKTVSTKQLKRCACNVFFYLYMIMLCYIETKNLNKQVVISRRSITD